LIEVFCTSRLGPIGRAFNDCEEGLSNPTTRLSSVVRRPSSTISHKLPKNMGIYYLTRHIHGTIIGKLDL
jgi:hypothetical protein